MFSPGCILTSSEAMRRRPSVCCGVVVRSSLLSFLRAVLPLCRDPNCESTHADIDYVYFT